MHQSPYSLSSAGSVVAMSTSVPLLATSQALRVVFILYQ